MSETIWEATEKLRLTLNGVPFGENGVEYPLYEDVYQFGLKGIFHAALYYYSDNEDEKRKLMTENRGNIYSFVGNRGSGKTTAMNEFCSILRKMGDDSEKHKWLEGIGDEEIKKKLWEKRFCFRVLEPIDAALLDSTEDLFELILTNLFHRFSESGSRQGMEQSRFLNDMKVAEISRQFQDILKMYRSVRKRSDEDYYLPSGFQFIGSSQDVRKKIAELLDSIIRLDGERSDYHFFVIAVDDLDLNLEYGYQMLMQMQKYFSYFKIIILTAVDYEQMGDVFEQYFLQHRKETENGQRQLQSGEILYERILSNNYMTKGFPLSQRLFMPDIRKNSGIMAVSMNGKEIPVKQFLMIKIAASMRIFYDICSTRRHFSEPNTVRYLVGYNDFLNLLNRLDYGKLTEFVKLQKMRDSNRVKAEKQNREILQAYDKNHSRFNWEITARQAQCTLSARELKYFKSMLQYNLEDRARYLMFSSPMSKKTGQKSLAENRRSAYTYGLMLENIHNVSSYDLTKRNLISCIEASFTSEMVREYMQYRYQPDEDARERSRMRLVSFLGDAFSGDWLGSMISEISTELFGKPSLRICRFGRNAVMSSLDIRFSVLSWDNFGGDEEDWRNVLNDWFEETGIMEVLECIDMFFVKRESGRYEGVSFLGKVVMAKDEDVSGGIASETKYTPVLKITADGSCALDVLGFIPKSMDYRHNRKRVVENAVSVIQNALNNYLDSRLFQPGEIGKILKMIPSLAKKYSAMPDKEDGICFPYYNLDLSYNVLERVRTKFSGVAVVGDRLLNRINEIYQEIENELGRKVRGYKEIDRVLQSAGVETGMATSDLYRYEEMFHANPYQILFRDFIKKTDHAKKRLVSVALQQMTYEEITPEETSDN